MHRVALLEDTVFPEQLQLNMTDVKSIGERMEMGEVFELRTVLIE